MSCGTAIAVGALGVGTVAIAAGGIGGCGLGAVLCGGLTVVCVGVGLGSTGGSPPLGGTVVRNKLTDKQLSNIQQKVRTKLKHPYFKLGETAL